MTALTVSRLTFSAHHVAVRDVAFTVSAGHIGALFGRDTSGVREVLRALAGLERDVAGGIRLDEIEVGSRSIEDRGIGLVTPETPLFRGTVRDNLAFGLRHRKWPRSDRERRVAAVLELVGLAGAEDDPVDTLTTGERGRVLLARAIAPEPSVLLLESPAWYVAPVERPEFRARLREVLQSLDIPVVIGTADLDDAVELADELHVMHEGQLLQSGSLSRVLHGPSSIDVAELVGYLTLVRGEVRGDWILEVNAGAVQFPAGFPLSGIARAMAHPSAMLGVPESSGLGCGVTGSIERIRAVGPTFMLDLRVGERLIPVRWEWDAAPPSRDEPIAIAVTPGTLRFFSEPVERLEPPAGADEGAPEVEPTAAAASPPAEDDDASDWRRSESGALSLESEPAESVEEPAAVEAESSGTAPSPAPAPPRARTAEAVGGSRSEPDSDDAGALPPWLSASTPPAPRRSARPEDPHRGMPLD